MSRPDQLPSWCDDDAASKVIEPSSTKKLQGWIYKERPAAQFWNWIFRNFVKWVAHFDVSVNQFSCNASEPADVFLNVSEGNISNGVVTTSKALQQIDFTGLMPTAAATSRIDVIVINNLTGVASRVAGVAAGSPTRPAVSNGVTVLCEVLIGDTDTVIANSMITDLRMMLSNIQLIDEDDMVSNSNKVAATQQSVKTYVDAKMVMLDEPELLVNNTATINSWQTFNVAANTLKTNNAKIAILRLVASCVATSSTTAELYIRIRKTGTTGTPFGGSSIVAQSYTQLNTSTTAQTNAAGDTQVALDASNEFDWYLGASGAGTPSASMDIMLVGYYK